MTHATDVVLAHHTSSAAQSLLDELCDVYADAYGVDPDGEKVSAFRDRATAQLDRPSFDLVTARADGRMVGFALGYALPANTFWWDGLTPEPAAGFATEDGTRTVVLSEIEVRQAWQGMKLGRQLHDGLLANRTEQRATLATGPGAEHARAIYSRWGWQSVGTVPGKPGAYFSEYHLFVLPLPIDAAVWL